MQKLLKRQSGFTLIELIIVMVVIGILLVLLLPNLSIAPKKARDTQRRNDLRTVAQGLEHYFADNSVYPSGNYAGLTTPLVPNYAKSLPADPKAGQSYSYTPGPASCTTACNSFTLTATLEYVPSGGATTFTVTNNQ